MKIPYAADRPALFCELKRNKSAEGAIDQIRMKRAPDLFGDFKGKVLLCGINYDRDAKDKLKQHQCVIEEWDLA